MLRKPIKKSLQLIGSRHLNRAVRKLRELWYKYLDSAGRFLFSILRGVHILPLSEEFIHEKVNRILVIRTDRIGDLILSTPSLTALRARFPKAHISFMVNSYTKDLVVGAPMINEVIAYDSKISLLGKLRLIIDLRRSRFDLAVILYSTFWSCLVAFLSGALFRIGYRERGGGFLLTTPIPPKKGNAVVHEVENTLDIVRVIGADTEDKELYICITEQGKRYAKTFFKEKGISSQDKIVAIHPGARQGYIRWQKEGFAEVADNLIEKYYFKILLIGDDSEKYLVEDLLRMIRNKKEVIPARDTTLTQLVSLLKRCNLFIGNSTGPMHLAAALKVPVVAIFGCIHPLDSYKKWGPWGDGHIVVSKNLNCPECHPSDCNTFDCMRLITSKEVLEAASRQIRTYGYKKAT